METPEPWTDRSMPSDALQNTRWYSPEQVKEGATLFRTYCAECHGRDAQGMPKWRRQDPDGTMHGFADKLDDQQIDAILAWIQSHWSEEVYTLWRDRATPAP